MKHLLIRTCQITFIAAVALLYLWKGSAVFSDAWKEVSEVNATFAADQRAQLSDVTRTVGEERVIFLFHPDKCFFSTAMNRGKSTLGTTDFISFAMMSHWSSILRRTLSSPPRKRKR